jgi:alanine racemase
MDWTLVDLTNVPNVKVGDEVILIGNQNGLQVLTEDLAGLAETISYEVTCGIHRRVPRVYKG